MEEKVHVRPSLGSRLPKFGGIKSGESLLQSVANGTPVGVLVTSNSSNGRGCIKQNGTAPTSSTSESWRKQNSHPTNDHNAVGSATLSCNQTERLASHKKYLRPDGGGGKDALKLGLKNSSSLTSKTEHPANMFVSTTEELNQKPLTGLSHSAKFTKGTFLGRTSYSGLHAPKPQVNGFFTNRPTVGLHRPRANSATARISLKEGLAQATDSMKSLSCDRMIRSQSFSHSIQNSLLPTATLTRSHSFNRAVDLTKPYQNQHATIRAFQRSNLLSRSTRQSEIPSGTEPHLKYNFSRTAMPVSVLKKPSLTNGPELASPLEYQMNRPSLLKPNRSQFASKIIVDGAKTSSVDSCILEKAEPSQSDKGRATDEQKALMEKSHQVAGHRLGDSLETLDSKGQYFSDDVDEISISSLSSSDKNDLSEDFSDDFLDLDDPNITVIKVKTEEHPPQSTMEKAQSSPLRDAPVSQCKTEDWINMSISVQDKSQSSENTYEIVPVSPDMDYREGSSLELSPSDSSDGTYMWDEEGLEPIGSVHPCGSYESSEMNSIDVLNNLDSCDIEDDDLMLDVDLPEDTPSAGVEAENMNLFERPERNIRQPQQQVFWKRSQQRRNGQEHYHLSSTDHFHHSRELNRRNAYLDSHTGLVENYGPSNLFQAPRAAQMMGLHENIVMLDEMTLRHMVQDCTQVKTQLLKLKRLLQSEDTESLQDLELSTPVTPEPNEAETTLKDANCGELDRDLDSQKCEAFPNNSAPLPPKVSNSSFRTDDLLNEIRQLKAEAKIKDERIKQLEHQLATRCNCCKEGQEPKREHRLHCEKYTQTPWRKVSPQILQRSSSTPSPTDHSQGRLARPSLIEGLSEYQDEPVYKNVNHLSQNVGNYSEPIDSDPGELSDLLSAQLQINDFAENGPTTECLQTENKLPVCRQQTLNDLSQPHTHPSFRKTSSQVETRTELHTKLAVKTCKKSSLGKNSRPKTLQLAMPKKEFAVVHHAEEPTERSQNKSQTCDEPQLQTMDDLLSELPVTCDVPSDLQSTCSSPSHFPPTDTSPLQLQPTNPGVLQLHVTVASPSQLHFTVTNPSQLWPSNASLSHMPVNHLVESQLASASPQDPPADSPSQLELPGDAALLHSKADTQYDLHSRSDRLSQPSSSDSTVLQPNAASLSDREPQVQDVSSVKSPAAIPSPLKLPSTSQSNLKSQAGSQTTLKSPSACLMTKSPVIDPMSSKSSTASPAALKSPASSPLMMKLPATKPSVKNLAAASASVQRLPAGAALPLKQHTASPSKQPPPEAVLLQVKPPSVNPAQLQPSATNLAISASKQSSANSKLRPPSIFLSKSRQVNNPEKPSMLVFHDPLKSSSKTTVSNIPRPLTQKKDTHHGDSTNSSRLSRLPKPKTQ